MCLEWRSGTGFLQMLGTTGERPLALSLSPSKAYCPSLHTRTKVTTWPVPQPSLCQGYSWTGMPGPHAAPAPQPDYAPWRARPSQDKAQHLTVGSVEGQPCSLRLPRRGPSCGARLSSSAQAQPSVHGQHRCAQPGALVAHSNGRPWPCQVRGEEWLPGTIVTAVSRGHCAILGANRMPGFQLLYSESPFAAQPAFHFCCLCSEPCASSCPSGASPLSACGGGC